VETWTWEKKILNLRLHWWCMEHAQSLTQWGGEGSSWPTMFVTCQLLVWSPTYFEIIYDLWGQQNLLLAICGFCPWLTLKYYMTLWARKNLLLAIRGFCPWLMFKYYMTHQVNRVSHTKLMSSAIIPHFCVKVTKLIRIILAEHGTVCIAGWHSLQSKCIDLRMQWLVLLLFEKFVAQLSKQCYRGPSLVWGPGLCIHFW
jgi:hypothetical protein